MTSIVVSQFGGMIPRLGRQKLPSGAALLAKNCLLLSGELRALHQPAPVADFRNNPDPIRRSYRIVRSNNIIQWATFHDETVDFHKGPLVNDKFERYYWTSETDVPRYNTADRIESGLPSYVLGVPQPDTPMLVAPPSQAALPVTRAYSYTFVTSFGEEGPLAEPTIGDGDEVGTWSLSGMATTPPVPWDTESAIITKRIYRTITGTLGNVDFHFIADIPLAQTSYADNVPTSEAGLNYTVQSELWFPPPKNLIGIVLHPNGFLVGFTGGTADTNDEEDATIRDIYFSDPYRPHAWNPGNVLSTDHPVRGLGVFGTSIAVATLGHPYVLTGIQPQSIVPTKAETPEPCVSSRRGLVSMPYGVLFPTDKGLTLIGPSGISNITKQLITKDEWVGTYTPSLFRAARYQNQYIAFYSRSKAILFSPDEANVAFSTLEGYWDNDAIQEDPYSGDVYITRDNIVYNWNPPNGVPSTVDWVCKEFETPSPVNFGAARIIYDTEIAEISEEVVAQYTEWNQSRYDAGPLAPLNFSVTNGVEPLDPGDNTWPPLPENKNAAHFGPLINITQYTGGYDVSVQAEESAETVIGGSNNTGSIVDGLGTAGSANVDVNSIEFLLYANGRLVFVKNVTNTDPFKLPSGYLATRWSFRIRTSANVLSVKLAETGKELAGV